jgi:hypothetical protein
MPKNMDVQGRAKATVRALPARTSPMSQRSPAMRPTPISAAIMEQRKAAMKLAA